MSAAAPRPIEGDELQDLCEDVLLVSGFIMRSIKVSLRLYCHTYIPPSFRTHRQVDPECVVLNWECSSAFGDVNGFGKVGSMGTMGGNAIVLNTVDWAIRRGCMVMFSDFSLKSVSRGRINHAGSLELQSTIDPEPYPHTATRTLSIHPMFVRSAYRSVVRSYQRCD